MGEYSSIGFYDVLFLVNIGILGLKVDWEAMMNFSMGVEFVMVDLGTETEAWDQLIVVIIH